MASGIRIKIETHGDFAYGNMAVPLQIEVADQKLKPITTQITHSKQNLSFELQPGIYSVSATTPSGSRVQRVVEVTQDETQDITLPLHNVSPREDYEWAYMTQKRTRRALLQEETGRQEKLKDTWFRLWWKLGNSYQVMDLNYESHPTPNGKFIHIQVMQEGVAAIQVGGPEVPWKCVSIPPLTSCNVLIQASPKHSRHPLDVTVASENPVLEGLLALLRRGEVNTAKVIEQDQAQMAEEMVFDKRQDPVAAAVGGYFLLRINDHQRLHNWANNLANWFRWMPDGAIIHAWQLIAAYRENSGAEASQLDLARLRLIEGVKRGYPIYSEGLRLLRDGLLLFDREADREDPEIRAARNKAGAYYSAADLSAPTTTFLGETPDLPSPKLVTGTPGDQTGLRRVFD